MRLWRALASIWPGGRRLVRDGAGDAFWLAGGFAMLVNAAIYLEWVAPDAFIPSVRVLAWICVGAYWVWAYQSDRARAEQGFIAGDDQHETTFRQAQKAYLQRDWSGAERLLRKLLANVADDLEARLLLVSVLRRAGRREEALRELRRVGRRPGSHRWQWELERERQLLEAVMPVDAIRCRTLPLQPVLPQMGESPPPGDVQASRRAA
ncbi:MAG: hypothetical protein KatS3mg110_1075 [Pirellulaceae bacterium]|nr:MAG: hypothetical protein KatS3mg110_1075 [Pirellulaceae bacterium]